MKKVMDFLDMLTSAQCTDTKQHPSTSNTYKPQQGPSKPTNPHTSLYLFSSQHASFDIGSVSTNQVPLQTSVTHPSDANSVR